MEYQVKLLQVAICRQCGDEFFPKSQWQKFCNIDCRHDWNNGFRKFCPVCDSDIDRAKKGFPFGTASEERRTSTNAKLEMAVNSGKLSRPRNCSKCGTSKGRIVAHHEDYDKPLEVIWVCSKCHAGIHTLSHYLNQEEKIDNI